MQNRTSMDEKQFLRAPAIVLGCLNTGTITVIICPGNGHVNGGVHTVLAVELIPFDLRMPNSEFDVVLDRYSGELSVLRRD